MEFSVLRKLRFSVPENRVISTATEKQSRQTIRRFKLFFLENVTRPSFYSIDILSYFPIISQNASVYTLYFMTIEQNHKRDFDFSCEKYEGGS